MQALTGPSISTEELVTRIREGHPRAFKAIYARYVGTTASVLTGQVQSAQAQPEPAVHLLPGEQARYTYTRADPLLAKENYAYADVFSWKACWTG